MNQRRAVNKLSGANKWRRIFVICGALHHSECSEIYRKSIATATGAWGNAALSKWSKKKKTQSLLLKLIIWIEFPNLLQSKLCNQKSWIWTQTLFELRPLIYLVSAVSLRSWPDPRWRYLRSISVRCPVRRNPSSHVGRPVLSLRCWILRRDHECHLLHSSKYGARCSRSSQDSRLSATHVSLSSRGREECPSDSFCHWFYGFG